MKQSLHPIAWLAWVVAAGVALSATRNPFHLLISVLGVAFTALTCTPQARILRIAAAVVFFSAGMNLLVARNGTTILAQLPANWPLIGGNLTLESLLFGALSGLALAGIIAACMAAQQAIPTRILLDILPAALTPLAVTLTIAVAFVPATLRQLRQIREAQAVRGHRLRGLRDWLAILLPLLIGGLDRALQLAEALAARGFPDTRTPARATGLLMSSGLGLLIGGLLISQWAGTLVGWLLLTGGLALIGLAIWQTGRATPRVRYRRIAWMLPDTCSVLVASIVIGMFVLPVPLGDRSVLLFSPYPHAVLPGFNPWIGLATLGLAWPGLLSIWDTR